MRKKIWSILVALSFILSPLFMANVYALPQIVKPNAILPSNGKYYLPWKGGEERKLGRAGSTHERAIDVPMPIGTPIYSIEAGIITKIVQANTISGCGDGFIRYNNEIRITHLNGEVSFYLHINTNSVPAHLKEGQYIPRGTLIAHSGKIGNVCGTTGQHLHFELQRNGVRVDARFVDVPGEYVVGYTKYTSGNTPAPLFDGSWYLNPNNATSDNANLTAFQYGSIGDLPVVGDWDGDGKDTVGVFRPANATWYLNPSNAVTDANTALIVFQYGTAGDIPIVGDWDGDGKDTVGVFRPSNATWYLNPNNAASDNSNLITFQYGLIGDLPVVGDWDGDGKDTVGIFRSSNATWYLNPNNTASDNINLIAFQYGLNGDTPVVGDWDGDEKDTVGVFRPSNATWYLNPNNAATDQNTILLAFQYGMAGDLPIVGDWDGIDSNGKFIATAGIAR